MTTPSTPARPYLSNGQVLSSRPLTVRIRNFFDDSYNFIGLYITTLFSLDAYAAAEQSPFNIRNRGRSTPAYKSTPRAGGGGGGDSGGGSGGGGGGSGPGGPSKKFGSVNDVRGPECKSCG